MNCFEKLSKILQIFLYTNLSRRVWDHEGRTLWTLSRILQFRYTITNALHIYRRPAKFLTFLQTVERISRYSLSGEHSYTRGPLADTNSLSWETSILKKPRWNSIILNLIAALLGYTSYYVTTSSLTLPIHNEVIIAKWSDEYSEHKKNPGIVVM